MSAPHRSGTGRGHARRTLALLVPLAAVLIGAGCTGGEDDLGGEAVARVTAGDMVEFASGGGWVNLEAGDEIPSGARIRTGDAEAHVAFRSGEVWLAPQAAAEIVDDRLDLLRGEALVASSGDLWAQWTEVDVRGEGVYRVTPGIAPRLGVYSGQVQVRRGAEVRTVPALRETSLSSRRLPSTGQPLSYRSDDPWDQALLADEIAFDNEAERLVRGLARQYGTTPRPAEFYGTFTRDPQQPLPPAPRANGEDWRSAPPGEALLRLFVAQAAAGRADALEGTLQEVGELRAAGARWGLVATELGVTTQRLAEVVDAGQARYTALREQRAAAAPPPPPSAPPQDAPTDAAAPQQAAPPATPDEPPAVPPDAPPSGPEPPAGGETPEPQPVPDAPDTGSGAGDDTPPAQPEVNPADLLGRQQPPKGLIETVVDLLLGLL